MTTSDLLTNLWRFDSLAWLVAAGALALYLWAFRPVSLVRLGAFVAALLAFVVALTSPIAALADGYLFSAHMAQHLILLLLVPPLAIASLPPARVATVLERPGPMLVEQTIGRPPASWMLGLGIMWFWHIPTLCSASVGSSFIHVIQCVTLLIAGTAFFWPIMNPRLSQRLGPAHSIIYLFTGCLTCTALGILLTFAPVSACPVYMHPADPLGIMPLLHSKWNLTHARDQQIGGLMMWVPACMVYLTAILAVARRWLSDPGAPARTSTQIAAARVGKGSHGVG